VETRRLATGSGTTFMQQAVVFLGRYPMSLEEQATLGIDREVIGSLGLPDLILVRVAVPSPLGSQLLASRARGDLLV
jgi:hypothetical protein